MKKILSLTILLVVIAGFAISLFNKKADEGEELSPVTFKVSNKAYNLLSRDKKVEGYEKLIEEAEKKTYEFVELDNNTPYSQYDSMYGNIVEKYLLKLDKEDYIKYMDVLSDKEVQFLYNPNRYGQP